MMRRFVLLLLVATMGGSLFAADDDALLEGDLLSGDSASQDDGLLGGGDLLSGDGDLLSDDGDLLSGDGDLLSDDSGGLLGADEGGLLDGDLGDLEPAQQASAPAGEEADAAGKAHLDLFAENRYPSSNTCATCHPKQYEQWSVSQHAYAQMSPVYMAMQITINAATSSTNGDFCIRCHTQVGMNIGESPFISNLDRHPTSREGITCVVCHRLDKEYGKVSGRVALVEGSLVEPVYGPKGNAELERVLNNTDKYRVVTDPDAPGRKIHNKVGHFPYIGTSGFCGVCHDVNLFNGFRLEEAFSDYKQSPAAREGISCQDCHMGKEQGVPSGYEMGPAAEVGGVPTADRKLTNHFFAGPDYSLLHPGIFPHNVEAAKMATLREWLKYDHEAGWGTDEFEEGAGEDAEFPDRWWSIDDRYDAREIIEYQKQRLAWAAEQRLTVLQNALALRNLQVEPGDGDLRFSVDVHNITKGHSVPTGFDAERVIWLQVNVTNADGEIVFQSGDLDPNGDVRDAHSLYVHNGDLPLDDQLFSLQSKFITRNLRGAEREQVLAVNFSVDPLPFIRPSTSSTILTGQPGGARKHRYIIPPLAKRPANYRVKARDLKGPGPFKIDIALKAGMVPVNLIDAIKGVGFDYYMSPREIADAVVAGHQTIDQVSTQVDRQGRLVAEAR